MTHSLTLVDCQAKRIARASRADLLRGLHPTGYRDLRAMRSDLGQPKTLSLPADDLDGLSKFATRFDNMNVYVGVAPRTAASGRATDDCEPLHALFADLDFKDIPEHEARRRLAAFPFQPSAVVASGGGLQAYWFLAEPLSISQAKPILRSLAKALGADLAAAEPARILRLPATLNHKYSPPRPVEIDAFSGRRYPLADVVAVLPVVDDAPTAPPPLPPTVATGSRNDTLFREGCRLRRLGFAEEEIRAALVAVNRRRCQPPLDAREVETIARSSSRYDPAVDTFPTTETGDAEFFAACNADTVRYDHLRGRWLMFDDHVWVPQGSGEIARRVLDSVRARQRAAEGNKERLKWAASGESRKRQTNLSALAQNIHPLADPGDAWDLDPWLLGAPNGVIDLRTGTLRPGLPEDRITMRVRAPFDPAAVCSLWDRTVAEVFEGDAALIAYVGRYVGYALTGDCREESLALCWGEGANGKGTLLNTIGWLLGDYADDLPFSAFELHSRAGIPNDIAKITGKRFITASETAETVRLNESRIKALTGRDPITARFLHKEFFTFQPVAKFWLSSNHKPEVRDDSEGFWRRLHLIPFAASFIGREDKTLKDRLREEAAGILAWAVRGCLAWQREGLNPPEVVSAATTEYRTASKPLARFLDECCVVQKFPLDEHMLVAETSFSDLFAAYIKWCGHEQRMGRHEFSAALRQQFEAKQANGHAPVMFQGVAVLPGL